MGTHLSSDPLQPPSYIKRCGASISIHKRGFETSAPIDRIPPPPGTAKRGTIGGWSARSRMRLRRALLTLKPPEHFSEWALTLTVPGPVVKPEQYRRLWVAFALKVFKRGWSAIWRVEVQARGALHWHVILHLPPWSEPSDACEVWHDILACPEPVCVRPDPTEDDPDPEWTVYDSRIEMPGALQHSAHVDSSDGTARWWRYLADHSSKRKQEQIGHGIGRHWGIIGRERYGIVRADLQRVSDSTFYRVLRALQRLSTPVCKEPAAPFGRKLSARLRRGFAGRSVWFTSPEVVKRLIAHYSE